VVVVVIVVVVVVIVVVVVVVVVVLLQVTAVKITSLFDTVKKRSGITVSCHNLNNLFVPV